MHLPSATIVLEQYSGYDLTREVLDGMSLLRGNVMSVLI